MCRHQTVYWYLYIPQCKDVVMTTTRTMVHSNQGSSVTSTMLPFKRKHKVSLCGMWSVTTLLAETLLWLQIFETQSTEELTDTGVSNILMFEFGTGYHVHVSHWGIDKHWPVCLGKKPQKPTDTHTTTYSTYIRTLLPYCLFTQKYVVISTRSAVCITW